MSYQDVLDIVGADVGRMDSSAVAAMLPILDAAQRELTHDLAKWLSTVPKGDEKFTAQKYRQALTSIKHSLAEIKAMEPAMFQALLGNSASAGNLAIGHLMMEIQNFSLLYEGEARPTAFNVASILAQGKKELIPQHRTSAARYVGQVGADIRAQLAVGVVRGETMDQLVNRLVRLGGPKGPVALRGVAGEPGALVVNISEGLFTRYRYWAERVARTEVLNAYNAHAHEGLRQLAEDDPEMEKRWDASLDSRLCKLCQGLHGQSVRVTNPQTGDAAAFPGGFVHPPAHPQCRCAVVAWHKDWAGPSEAMTMHPDGSAEADFQLPPEKPVKPAKAEPTPKLHPKFEEAQTKLVQISHGSTDPDEVQKKGKEYVKFMEKAVKGQNADLQHGVAQGQGFKDAHEMITALKAQLKFEAWAAKDGWKNYTKANEIEAKAKAKKAEDAAKAAAKEAKEKIRAAKEQAKLDAAAAKEQAKLARELSKRGGGRLTASDFPDSRTSGARGMAVAVDTGKIEGLTAQVVRVRNENTGVERTEVSMKLVSSEGERMAEKWRREGEARSDRWFYTPRTMGADGVMKDDGGVHDKGKWSSSWQDVGGSLKKNLVTPSGIPYTVELGRDGALRNSVRITLIPHSPENIAAVLEHFHDHTKVDVLRVPTKDDHEAHVRNRIMSKIDPAGMSQGTPSDKAKNHPLVDRVVSDAKVVEVYPGHLAPRSETLRREFENVVSGLTHDSSAGPDVAEKILSGSGLQASATRFGAGTFVQGMSTGTDFGTGGADGVFLRVVNPGQSGLETSGGRFRFVVKPDEMGRLDWWAFDHDNYGRSGPNDARKRWTVDGIKNDKASGGNEVMFQKGVPVSSMSHVVCSSSDRADLIQRLKSRGITQINGQKIEDFVRVEK